MKWNTAVKKIEKALAEGHEVQIVYHTKYAKIYQSQFDLVENVLEYDWQGTTCKAINTNMNQLNESSHTIEAIFIDSFM